MNWTLNIFSTLKTWVFKKKLLKFSDRYRADTQACFYCPEMCRFSCPTAETLRANTVTPRGKVSIVHWLERGESAEKIAGSKEQALWFLEQCTGCGRCTEYCLYENDVAGILREARRGVYQESEDRSQKPGARGLGFGDERLETRDESLEFRDKKVLVCESGRAQWWKARTALLERLGVVEVLEWSGPHREWLQGTVSNEAALEFLAPYLVAAELCFESPEVAWFFVSVVEEKKRPRVRLVWQEFFADFLRLELRPEQSFHESYHLSRLLPRVGVSVPMYERGLLPQHSGWNTIDCGGEGWYKTKHPEHAALMRERFLADLRGDGRTVDEIVCQSLDCLEHLSKDGLKATYWLDLVTAR